MRWHQTRCSPWGLKHVRALCPRWGIYFFFLLLINILSMKLIENILQDHVDNHPMDDNYSRNDHWLDLGARASEPDKELPCFSPSFQSQTRSWEWWLWCFCDGSGGDKDEDTSGKDGDCDDNYHALIKSFPCILIISRNCSQDTVKGFSRGEPEWVLGVREQEGKEEETFPKFRNGKGMLKYFHQEPEMGREWKIHSHNRVRE